MKHVEIIELPCLRCGKKVASSTGTVAEQSRILVCGNKDVTLCQQCTTPNESFQISQIIGQAIITGEVKA